MSLILALQISHKDVTSGIELCQLCADIEQRYEPRRDCEFWVVYSKKVPETSVRRMVDALSPKFVVKAIPAKNKGEGFPYGPYALWLSTMMEAWAPYKHRQHAFMDQFTGIFTFEADCVPLRQDWINALTQEWEHHIMETFLWNKAHDREEHRQFEVMGHVHQAETVHKHINGNAVFRCDMLERKMIETHEHVGWDFWPPNRDYLLSVGKDTNLITQLYARPSITPEELAHVRKNGVTPAILHGIKDGSARHHARKLLCS